MNTSILEFYAFLHLDNALAELAIVAEFWREIMTSSRFSYFWVFEMHKLVAKCSISIIPNLTRAYSSYRRSKNVMTHTDLRNRGFLKALLHHSLTFAWHESCYKVMLLTERKDKATFNSYGNVGFSRHEKQAFMARPSS